MGGGPAPPPMQGCIKQPLLESRARRLKITAWAACLKRTASVRLPARLAESDDRAQQILQHP